MSGIIEQLVHWTGCNGSFNSCVKVSDVKTIVMKHFCVTVPSRQLDAALPTENNSKSRDKISSTKSA